MGNKIVGLAVGMVILFLAFGVALLIQGSTMAAAPKDLLSLGALVIGVIAVPVGLIVS